VSDPSSFFGLYRGIVRANDDRASSTPYRGLVKVYVPQVYGEGISDDDLPWAEPCFIYGGGRIVEGGESRSFGIITIPPIGASVWVMFEHGDIGQPVVVGAWYGAKDANPEMPAEAVEDWPNVLLIRDPSSDEGMFIRFKMGSYLEIVALKDKTFIKLNASTGAVDVQTETGNITIQTTSGDISALTTTGKIYLANGEFETSEPDADGNWYITKDTLQRIEMDPASGDTSETDYERGEDGGNVTTTARMQIWAKKLDIRAGEFTLTSEKDIQLRAREGTFNSSSKASGFEQHGV